MPDHTTLSRRRRVDILQKSICRNEPLTLLIDSTGLMVYGEGDWLDQKHDIPSPRRWRKLLLGVDADTHEVAAVAMTQNDVGEVSEIVGLLDRVATCVASLIADGAYDAETLYDAVTDRYPEADIVIPPRAIACHLLAQTRALALRSYVDRRGSKDAGRRQLLAHTFGHSARAAAMHVATMRSVRFVSDTLARSEEAMGLNSC